MKVGAYGRVTLSSGFVFLGKVIDKLCSGEVIVIGELGVSFLIKSIVGGSIEFVKTGRGY